MKNSIVIILFLMLSVSGFSQKILITEGQTFTNSATDTWIGVNIPRSEPTKLTFRNNSITSVNSIGYLLQAGDEGASSNNNNLDNAVITGNKFTWNGSDMKSITHGLFTGHESNVIVKYNYLNKVPMGIVRKSTTNMSNTSGGVAYNIVKGGAVGMVVKGMSNVNIYNNTFYTDRTTSETWRPLIHIYTNTDREGYSVAHGTKIYNNIFYTKYQTFSITIDDTESLKGFESDYNVYWCETGSPKFLVAGSTKTFAQWQAMGYDKHSVVMNPNFKDFISFVPAKRLDYGKDLGTEWIKGLAVTAVWGKTDPETASQNGTWQVGAVIYGTGSTPDPVASAPVYNGSAISAANPSVVEMSYSTLNSTSVPAVSAFVVRVNSIIRKVTTVQISGNKVLLTLESPVVAGDVITVSYTTPAANQLAGTGGNATSLTPQTVTNNLAGTTPGTAQDVITISPNPAREFIKVSIQQPKSEPYILRIFDEEGQLNSEFPLVTTSVNNIPLNLRAGSYMVHVVVGSVSKVVQRLVIIE